MLLNPLAPIRRLAALPRDKRGNVLMLFAFSLVPLTFATGMTIDYSRAMRLQTKLNAAADAAALAAVTQPMMLNDTPTARAAAQNMFVAQSGNMPGLSNLAPSYTITGNNGATPTRTAVVSYTALSSNEFGGLLGLATLTIHGTSTATATAAPNIDFYLALDTSPSMSLPTTSDGLSQMDSKFSCTFACHSNKIENYAGGQSMPNGMIKGTTTNNPYGIKAAYYGSSTNSANGQTMIKIDSKGSYIYFNAPATKTISDKTTQAKCADASGNDTCVYNSDGTFVDSYWYALNQGISLRVTAERSAVGDLMSLAKSYAAKNKRTYRAALYTFDYGASPYSNIRTIASLTNNLDSITSASSNIDVVTVNDKAGNGCPPGATTCSSNQYLFTSFKSVMDKMATDMPATSGKGTNASGDTPQAFFFLVTDGMSDEDIGSGRTRAPMQQAQLDQCTALKNRGIKIAILYTEYTVASIQDDEPNQRAMANKAITQSPTIADRLSACASSPDLMYTVSTDQDISTALQSLFTRAMSNARLSK